MGTAEVFQRNNWVSSVRLSEPTCVGVLQGERALQMDVQEGSRLQLQAFEAINEVVRSASSDTLPLVGQLIQALLDKLASTFRMQIASSEAREHQNDLQVWLDWFGFITPHTYKALFVQAVSHTVFEYLFC